jgi:hypothetical protein
VNFLPLDKGEAWWLGSVYFFWHARTHTGGEVHSFIDPLSDPDRI